MIVSVFLGIIFEKMKIAEIVNLDENKFGGTAMRLPSIGICACAESNIRVHFCFQKQSVLENRYNLSKSGSSWSLAVQTFLSSNEFILISSFK